MHHTAFLVPDIQSELDRINTLGWELINQQPISEPMVNGLYFYIKISTWSTY